MEHTSNTFKNVIDVLAQLHVCYNLIFNLIQLKPHDVQQLDSKVRLEPGIPPKILASGKHYTNNGYWS